MKKLFAIISLLLLPVTIVRAQMLAVNVEAPPELTVTVMTDGNLDYGSVLQNQQYTIDLMDSRTEVISIQGKKNKSVNVILTSTNLMLDAANTIPYTLGAAYTNQGQNDKTQAIPFNGNTATFELNQQGSSNDNSNNRGNSNGNGGPGQGNQSTETAYVYIYGTIDVGSVRAGLYTGTININVSYD